MPDIPPAFTSKIRDGPQAITSAPMFVNGAPNQSDPRCAWYISQIKAGTSLSSIVPDGDYERVDPTTKFNKDFPPTYFLHGKKDVFVGYELAVRAHEQLKSLGPETKLVLGEEIGHAFDLQMVEGDDSGLFEKYVVPALDFLVEHV
jgi:pimeloyl-ACP methyl ester carboxylesterase